MDDAKNSSRRDLLRLASLLPLAGEALEAAPQQAGQKKGTPAPAASVSGMPFETKEKIRLGVIGVGGRGNSLVDNFSAMPEVQVMALCDTVKDKVLRTQAKLERAGKLPQAPGLYH